MVKQKNFIVVWSKSALNNFGEILGFLSQQSIQAPTIVKDGVLSRLELIKSSPHLFESDKLKENPDKDFRAFVVYSFRITYRVLKEKKVIRVIRIRHTSREPLGY